MKNIADMEIVDEFHIEEKPKDKKFSWLRAITTTCVILLFISTFFYIASVLSIHENYDKNSVYYKSCLDKIGLSSPTLSTLSLYTTKQVNVLASNLWRSFINLDNWKSWQSNNLKDIKWSKGDNFTLNNEFYSKYDFGIFLGNIEGNNKITDLKEGRNVEWTISNNDLTICNAFAVLEESDTSSQLVFIQIISGNKVGIFKPFIFNDLQKDFEKSSNLFIQNLK